MIFFWHYFTFLHNFSILFQLNQRKDNNIETIDVIRRLWALMSETPSVLHPSVGQQWIQSSFGLLQDSLKLRSLLNLESLKWHGAKAHSFLMWSPSLAAIKSVLFCFSINNIQFAKYLWILTIPDNSCHTPIVCLILRAVHQSIVPTKIVVICVADITFQREGQSNKN